MQSAPFAPHTYTITLSAEPYPEDLTAFAPNGARKVRVARKLAGRAAELLGGGAELRLVCPGVDPSDLLELLDAGKAGEHELPVRSRPFAARRDLDFEGAA